MKIGLLSFGCLVALHPLSPSPSAGATPSLPGTTFGPPTVANIVAEHSQEQGE